MLPDRWLRRWLPLVRQRAATLPVLELGCGSGADTRTLLAQGLAVVALDLSASAVAAARARAPAARFVVQDLRAPFPVPAGGTNVVVASLSLHYFAWDETVALVQRIRDTLGDGGLLLCRLNSTRDRHFGARGHPQIEPHLHDVHGTPKRFFDRADVERLFGAGWRMRALEEKRTWKYALPKVLWEVVLEKDRA